MATRGPDGRLANRNDTGPHAERIDALRRRAREDRAAFEAPTDPPDSDRALAYLRDGAGEAILVYVDAHVEGHDRFAADELEALEAALNEYLHLYAACYGESIEPSCSIRTAAEALIDTHDIRAVGQLLTHVPETR